MAMSQATERVWWDIFHHSARFELAEKISAMMEDLVCPLRFHQQGVKFGVAMAATEQRLHSL